MNNTKRRFVLAGIVSLSLLATACGDDEGASEATDAPATSEAPATTESGETTDTNRKRGTTAPIAASTVQHS